MTRDIGKIRRSSTLPDGILKLHIEWQSCGPLAAEADSAPEKVRCFWHDMAPRKTFDELTKKLQCKKKFSENFPQSCNLFFLFVCACVRVVRACFFIDKTTNEFSDKSREHASRIRFSSAMA